MAEKSALKTSHRQVARMTGNSLIWLSRRCDTPPVPKSIAIHFHEDSPSVDVRSIFVLPRRKLIDHEKTTLADGF
jgi:hypothetical protein